MKRLAGILTATSVAALLALPTAPAFAGTAERQAACTALGGTFNPGGSAKKPEPAKDKCTVTQTVVGPAVPTGTPTVTNSPTQDLSLIHI